MTVPLLVVNLPMSSSHRDLAAIGRRLGRAYPPRRAAAATELALIAPVLAGMLVGIFELGRGVMVKQMLTDAARMGCETGTLPLTASSAITSDVNGVLTANGISSGAATITILVNGTASDTLLAKQNDKISVKVAISVSQVAWTTKFLFLTSGTIESETVVMLRRG